MIILTLIILSKDYLTAWPESHTIPGVVLILTSTLQPDNCTWNQSWGDDIRYALPCLRPLTKSRLWKGGLFWHWTWRSIITTKYVPGKNAPAGTTMEQPQSFLIKKRKRYNYCRGPKKQIIAGECCKHSAVFFVIVQCDFCSPLLFTLLFIIFSGIDWAGSGKASWRKGNINGDLNY